MTQHHIDSRLTTLILVTAAAIALLAACQPDNPLVSAFRDTDGDQWYDGTRNQRIDLFIESIDNNTGTMFAARPAIAINDRIVVNSGDTVNANRVVASRTIGAWGMPEREDTFTADLRITAGDIHIAPRERFSFTNTPGEFTVSHNDYVVHFRTTRTLFADPSPESADADSDMDGLSDREEAQVNSPSRSLGDPTVRDLLLVVGFTHADWALTPKSRDLLTTVFFNRALVNLHIYTENDPVLGVTPGIVQINGTTPNRNHRLAFAEGELVRPQLVSNAVAELFHVLVLAEELNDGAWGRANVARPANDLICRSHFPVSGPDFYEYQAKTVMHELGHNLGLCHPTESDNTCPTGAIPVAERNAGLSAMGTPAESPGPVEVMLDALSRPLDYTPGQWANMDLRRVRSP